MVEIMPLDRLARTIHDGSWRNGGVAREKRDLRDV